jgi:argininosuccinate lyase
LALATWGARRDPTYPGATVTRLPEPQDPLFRRLNSSIAFDARLWPHDIRASKAHARALAAAGVLTDAELTTIEQGLDEVGAELEAGRFEVAEDDEDIHMAIERRLTEIAGPVGGKLHTARSRNDQVATDLALYVRDRAARARELIAALMARLLDLAERHADWPMPGYTHLQRAQAVYLGHHLLAYFWMLERDSIRFDFAARSTMALPLGSGALAGVDWELDRDLVARELGFARTSPNSLDAVSNRDFALDYLSAAATCAAHLSRLGAELVLWSTEEFGFCEHADEFSSGSSIMPQKKNPDAAELLRAKAPRIASSHARLLGVLHALPLAYSKDLQEDKEALFEAVDQLELCLEAAERLLSGLRFDRERLAAAADDDLLAATDLADLLVRRGMAFREAHGVIGGLVRDALASGRRLSELEPEELRRHSELLDESYYELLRERGWIESKRSAGGTASERVSEQLERARLALRAVREEGE